MRHLLFLLMIVPAVVFSDEYRFYDTTEICNQFGNFGFQAVSNMVIADKTKEEQLENLKNKVAENPQNSAWEPGIHKIFDVLYSKENDRFVQGSGKDWELDVDDPNKDTFIQQAREFAYTTFLACMENGATDWIQPAPGVNVFIPNEKSAPTTPQNTIPQQPKKRKYNI